MGPGSQDTSVFCVVRHGSRDSHWLTLARRGIQGLDICLGQIALMALGDPWWFCLFMLTSVSPAQTFIYFHFHLHSSCVLYLCPFHVGLCSVVCTRRASKRQTKLRKVVKHTGVSRWAWPLFLSQDTPGIRNTTCTIPLRKWCMKPMLLEALGDASPYLLMYLRLKYAKGWQHRVEEL